ncbi:MAG: glycosyltransferase [Bacteroidia bacterium]|nr:glycosyltransferase [Bacteroidia bacterium]
MQLEISYILFGVLCLFALLQIAYHYKYFAKFAFRKNKELSQVSLPVSIIICARNEVKNLEDNLPLIFGQKYPDFEVVVVNDASWDKTGDFINELSKHESRLKTVHISEDMKRMDGKKLALTLGIKASKHEILLFTDADCIPASENWISEMVKPYSNPETEIVLGYSPYKKKNGLLNLLIQMETLLTATSYFSFALKGKPYMGVGRNLSYKKSLFFNVKGFASHHHIAAGDDDLFVQDAATNKNTAVCYSKDSFMETIPQKQVSGWFRQKKRHLFVGKFYKATFKNSLGSFAFIHLFFWLSLTAVIIVKPSIWWWALIALGIKWIADGIIIFKSFQKLKQKLKVIWLPVFDLLFIPYNLVFGVVSVFSKQKKW